MEKKAQIHLWTAVGTAICCWFLMFSPWTSTRINFWVAMSLSAICLTLFSVVGLHYRHDESEAEPASAWLKNASLHLLRGIVIGALLWSLFWLGDKISSLIFDFARPQVDSIYGMKQGLPPWAIALLLLVLIGPAEEYFWRGYVQRSLAATIGENRAFVTTTAIYTLIHIWSFNFMLIMAAMVCGVVWGGLYRLKPQWLPALVISHALWDACVFVVFPI